MCHLILALPFLALPVLWLAPPGIGVPVYAASLAVAVAAYVMAYRAMKVPRQNGPEILHGTVGVVRSGEPGSVIVWAGSELWSAEIAGGAATPGAEVDVIGHRGLTLLVRPHRSTPRQQMP